jgi:hypothetical protein
MSSTPPVTKGSGWREIFGKNANDYPVAERRRRWAAWLRAARVLREDKPQASLWARGYEVCHGCALRRGGWCTFMGLPCTVNPVLTFRQGDVGMACMGTNFTPKQLSLMPAPGREQ